MSRRWVQFVVGALSGLGVAIALNLLPYWRSYHANDGDGYEIIGFPFVFRRLGGFAGIDEFRAELLIANVVLAFSFAALVGWVAMKFSRLIGRSGHGFPVVCRSDDSATAE